MKEEKELKRFYKMLMDYSQGKSPKGLRRYKIDEKGNKIEIIDKLELIRE